MTPSRIQLSKKACTALIPRLKSKYFHVPCESADVFICGSKQTSDVGKNVIFSLGYSDAEKLYTAPLASLDFNEHRHKNSGLGWSNEAFVQLIKRHWTQPYIKKHRCTSNGWQNNVQVPVGLKWWWHAGMLLDTMHVQIVAVGRTRRISTSIVMKAEPNFLRTWRQSLFTVYTITMHIWKSHTGYHAISVIKVPINTALIRISLLRWKL